jgi:hypothetical protein
VSAGDFSTSTSDSLNDRESLLTELKKITVPFNKLSEMDLFKMIDMEDEAQLSESQPHVLKQMITFVGDIKNKTKKFSGYINEIFDLLKQDSAKETRSKWQSQLEKEQIEIMVDISVMLDQLDAENLSLDNFLKQNKQLCEEIINNINSTISNIDYYDFFEKVIEDVINVLNVTTYKLKLCSSDQDKETTLINLKELKANYTMESERIIHQRVEENSGENTGMIGFSVPEEDDDSVELF